MKIVKITHSNKNVDKEGLLEEAKHRSGKVRTLRGLNGDTAH